MPTALQDERNVIDPRHLRLDTLTAYIRGDYNKPFPGPAWFTPARMTEIHKRVCRARACMIVRVGSADADTAMEIERYYLHLLSRYQFLAFGGEIGVENPSKVYATVTRARSIRDWHKLLDFLSDRMFYWARQHRVNVAQVEAMTRIWLLIRYYHKKRNESRSLQHANDMRHPRSIGKGRKPSARSSARRSPRSQRCGSAVPEGNRPAQKSSGVR